MEKLFHLSRNQTTIRRELISGLTIFLSMMYILFTNSSVLAEAGMPWRGVFAATALSAAVCSAFVALYANLPFGIAPGMGMNTIFAYTICLGAGYHWKEALAISFLAGAAHVAVMVTPLRKSFVNAFPEYLRAASGVGLGMFIAYIGIKNSGLLVFNVTSSPIGPSHVVDGTIMVPGVVTNISAPQLVSIVGFLVMIILTAREKKTGAHYVALPAGILAATFAGIPLGVTRMGGTPLYDLGFESANLLLLSFFDDPGLFSVFSSPARALQTAMMIIILSVTGVLDSIGTMIGIGQIHGAKLFDEDDMEKFATKGAQSKLDRAMIANSVSNIASPLLGSSPSTIFLESVTGIVSGGRTGLSALVVGGLFLLCLPFSNLFHMIPTEAVAPALVLAGVSMLTRMRYIDWRQYEESFPTFITILVIPLAHSILDGISLGLLCHVAIRLSLGKRKEIHPILYILAALYLLIKLCERFV